MTALNPTRVLIADDHVLVRAGIRALLERIPNIEVVGEASDGREALDLVRKHQPEVVLMDIAMPGLNGLKATRELVEKWPNVHVIILSMHSSGDYVWQALNAGARGYLLKDAPLAQLELAVSSVRKGEVYLSPPISQQVIAKYAQRTMAESKSGQHLTARQQEILQLIAGGRNTKQIALDLDISVKTVEAHRVQLMARLDIHDVYGLVRYAIRMGIVNID